jgi:hypothetical protein
VRLLVRIVLSTLVATVCVCLAGTGTAAAATSAVPRAPEGRYLCSDGRTVVVAQSGPTWRPGRTEGGGVFLVSGYGFELLVGGDVVSSESLTRKESGGDLTCVATGIQVDEQGFPIGEFHWTLTGRPAGQG